MRHRNVVLLWALAAASAQTGTFTGNGVPAPGSMATAWGSPGKSSIAAANAEADWKKTGADEGLRQAFERAAYSLEDSGHGTWRGVNPRQRLTLEFDGQEARLRHPDGSVASTISGNTITADSFDSSPSKAVASALANPTVVPVPACPSEIPCCCSTPSIVAIPSSKPAALVFG